MIFDELPSSWRFVDDQEKLNKNKACNLDCATQPPIVVTVDTMLPSFIWATSGNFFTPLSFILTETTTLAVIDLSSEIPNMECFTINGITYVSSNVINYPSGSPLIAGIYEAQIWDGLNFIYSEPIQICDDITHCFQLNWSNTCDLAGIPYAHLETAYGTPFINTMFVVDMSLLQATYETEKVKHENMLRQIDVFNLSQTRTFSVVNNLVPEWFVRAIQVMQLHDTRTAIWDTDATHPNGLYSALIEDCDVSSNSNESGGEETCSASMTIKFKQDDAVISTYCCVNSEPAPCLTACVDVIGFKDLVTPAEGDYAIDDVDSGVIVQWDGLAWQVITTTCVYVNNTVTGRSLFFDGDVWQNTPDLTSMTTNSVIGVTANVTIYGYTMPGTWVLIGTDNGGGCVYDPTPRTPADLIAGVTMNIAALTIVTICIQSFSHNCTYAEYSRDFNL